MDLAGLSHAGSELLPGHLGVDVYDGEPALGFTTIELKTNFLRSTQEGTIECEARLVHGGRTTQIWDATVTAPDARPMALFRCTQLLLRG